MLTGSKTTEIKTKAVTYKINVVETANIPSIFHTNLQLKSIFRH